MKSRQNWLMNNEFFGRILHVFCNAYGTQRWNYKMGCTMEEKAKMHLRAVILFCVQHEDIPVLKPVIAGVV